MTLKDIEELYENDPITKMPEDSYEPIYRLDVLCDIEDDAELGKAFRILNNWLVHRIK